MKQDTSGHIAEEVLKLMKQKDHLYEQFIQMLEGFKEINKGVALMQETIFEILPEFNHLHTRLKELESLTKPDKASNVESDLDLPVEYYGMSLWQKVQYHFEDNEKQTAPSILAKILEAEPSINEDEDQRRKTVVNLYATLNSKHKLKEITREKINGEFYYTLEQPEGI